MILEKISILSSLNIVSITVRIFMALVLGGILGIERQHRQRPAGFRTYIIVCLGATLASITNIYMYDVFGSDPSRIPAQVISGIGFLGAGTILVTRSSHVKGLTTAAGLWCAATIGVAIGSGLYTATILCTIIIIFSLSFLSYFDQKLTQQSKYMSFFTEFSNSACIKELILYSKKENISLHDLEIFKAPDDQNVIATFTVKLHDKVLRDSVYDYIIHLEGLIFIEEL